MLQVALERDGLEVWLEDLRVVATTLEDHQLSSFLNAPQVPAVHKLNAIRNVLRDSVAPLALNLVSILASRNLAHLVPDILEEYGRLLDATVGIERADIVSAVPLDSDQRARVAGLLEGVVGKQMRLSYFVEPEILGGLIARVGDSVLDGSARTKLIEMRRSIVEQVS